MLRAALEFAAATDPRITNSAAFKVGLKKLPDAARARNVVLTDEQVRRIVALAYEESAEFGRLIEVLAVTGARRSQAARLTVADLQNGRAPRLMMPSSLKGKGVKRIDRKPVPIPASLADKLRQAAGDRSGDALLLLKPDGAAWAATDLRAPFRRVVENAGLDPDVVTATRCGIRASPGSCLRGVPTRVVAASHDTQRADARKELQRDDRRSQRRALPQCPARPRRRPRRQGGAAGPEGLTVDDVARADCGASRPHRGGAGPRGQGDDARGVGRVGGDRRRLSHLGAGRTTYPISRGAETLEAAGRSGRHGRSRIAPVDDTLWTGPDPTWRDRALAVLSEVHRKVESARRLSQDMGSAFSGQQNPHREFLYWGVMRVWTDHLGGELRYSKSDKKKPPSGPLIRFLVACVEPILGDKTPGGGTRRHHRPRARGSGRHRGL